MEGAEAGDHFVFQCRGFFGVKLHSCAYHTTTVSGHGSQVPNFDMNDVEADGMDEG
jgi:hypothetical protein